MLYGLLCRKTYFTNSSSSLFHYQLKTFEFTPLFIWLNVMHIVMHAVPNFTFQKFYTIDYQHEIAY